MLLWRNAVKYLSRLNFVKILERASSILTNGYGLAFSTAKQRHQNSCGVETFVRIPCRPHNHVLKSKA